MAESEEWEIRWAKPIGPIKQAERQRCINEAISQSNVQKETRIRRVTRKQYSKVSVAVDNADSDSEKLDLQYVEILADFVARAFQATCSFDCIPGYNPFGYVYKVCFN